MISKKWVLTAVLGLALFFFPQLTEAGNIKLKLVVVNPSDVLTQEAILKDYLPKEVKPEDIIDLGDLRIDYDFTTALYYVYKEVELKPKETITRSVLIKDVWLIPQLVTDDLNARAKALAAKFKNTAANQSAIDLQNSIGAKLVDLHVKQQEALQAIPQRHIAVYRENLEILQQAREEFNKLEKMQEELKTQAASPPGVVMKKISLQMSWWLIAATILGLGLFSFIVFLIWNRQAALSENQKPKKNDIVTKQNSSEISREKKDEAG